MSIYRSFQRGNWRNDIKDNMNTIVNILPRGSIECNILYKSWACLGNVLFSLSCSLAPPPPPLSLNKIKENARKLTDWRYSTWWLVATKMTDCSLLFMTFWRRWNNRGSRSSELHLKKASFRFSESMCSTSNLSGK